MPNTDSAREIVADGAISEFSATRSRITKIAIAICCLLTVCFQARAETSGDQKRVVGVTAQTQRDISEAIRQRLADYERAWNGGDVQAVLSQYDHTLFAIWGADQLNYEEYTDKVKKTMSQGLLPRLKLVPTMVRGLSGDHAVASGYVESTSKDGSRHSASFTVIYQRVDGEWKLIHSHS